MMTLSKDNKPLYQRGWLAAKQATNNASIQNGCPAGTIEFSSRFDGASEIAAKTVCVCVCVLSSILPRPPWTTLRGDWDM